MLNGSARFCCYTDDESTTATEDEEDIRARELRKQEVWLKHPTRSSDTDTGSETEVKISQNSVDNVTQESLALPESISVQAPNLMPSQEANNSDTLIDQDIVDPKIIQSSSNTETLRTDMLTANTGQQVGNTSRSEACGSIIPILDFSLDLISDDAVNNIASTGPSLGTSNRLVAEDCLNRSNNMDGCISERENVGEGNVLSNANRIEEVSNALANENEHSQSNSQLNHIGSNELSDKMISINDESSIINFVRDESTRNIISVNNELNDVPSGLVVTSETSNTLDTELQTAFAGIMLPDAIPVSQTSYDNTMLLNTEESGSFKEKLPDLITSSPSRSRESSPSSSSEIYKSTETLYDELYMSDTLDKSSAEELESDDSRKCGKFNGDVLNKKGNKLKLFIKNLEQIPLVTITSPSPTNERPSEKASVEITKLTVPKKVLHQPVQSDGNSSFDKLKRDLRQRKARNKIPVGELRPLSTENARKKMSKYFVEETKQKTKTRNKNSPDVEIVEFDIKPKLSTKVEAKDIMKYFATAKAGSSENLAAIGGKEVKNKDDISVSMGDNNIDAINLQIEEIEPKGEELFSIDTKDIESKLHFHTPPTNLYLEDTGRQNDVGNGNEGEERKSSVERLGTEISTRQTYSVSEGNINLESSTLESKVHGDKTEVTVDSHEDIKSEARQTALTPLLDNVAMNVSLHEDKTATTVNSHKNVETNAKQVTLTPQLDKVKVTHIDKTNAMYASDSTLNMRKETANEAGVLHKASKSSYELTSFPSELLAKVKVVEQIIEAPKQVDKINIGNNTVSSDAVDEAPKRPERKHVQHELSSSAKSPICSMQSVPEIPARKRSAKRKSIVAPLLEESTSTVQSSSTVTNERLTAPDIVTDTDKNTIHIGANELQHSVEVVDNINEANKLSNTIGNTSVEQKHSHPAKSLASMKSDQCESTKSVPPKNDRSRKDRCVVS